MRVFVLEYSSRGSSPLSSVGLPLLALGGGVLRWSVAGLPGLHAWLDLFHPRGRRCERCGVRGPFRVAIRIGNLNLPQICRK